MISDYPISDKNYIFIEEHDEINNLIEIIKQIRNAKLEYNFKEYYLEINNIINSHKTIIKKMLKLNDVNFISQIKEPLNKIKLPIFNNYILIGYISNITENDIKESLLKEKELLETSIKKRQNLLSNENYISKAPKNIVELDKEKLLEEQKKLTAILEQLK
jgi:valyl-tRNA synthetase